MNTKTSGNGQNAEPQDAGSAREGDGVPILERSESFRRPSILKRTVAMLALESGISEEIASDRGATKQALVVFAIAILVSGGLPDSLESLPVAALAPLLGLLPLSISMVLYRLVSRIFAKDVPPYPNWFRALLFASAPLALGAIPQIGLVMGTLYAIVLDILVIRDLSRISTWQALATWLIARLLPVAILTLFLIFLGYSFIAHVGPQVFAPLLGL